MEATDNRSYDMRSAQEEDEHEQRGLIRPIGIEEAELPLTPWDLIFFLLWFFKFNPALAGAIHLLRAIVRFKIDQFDQFDHFEVPDLIGFSTELLIGVGINEGVEESNSPLGIQETNAEEQEEMPPVDQPPNPVPEPLSALGESDPADAHESGAHADDNDPVDNLTLDLAVVIPSRMNQGEQSSDTGNEADNENSSSSDDDRQTPSVTHFVAEPMPPPATNRRLTQVFDTRNNDAPSEPLPVAPVGRPRRKSRHRSTMLRFE